MTKPNDGGPAFPHAQKPDPGNPRRAEYLIGGGMSLRAWLAGKAISVVRPVYEVTSEPHKPEDGQLPPFSKIRAAVIAREACEVADALIAELEGKKEEVEAPEPKFKEGDRVRVKEAVRGMFAGRVGVVDSMYREYAEDWKYRVQMGTGDGQFRETFHEDCLEAVEDEGPKFMPVSEAGPPPAKFKVNDPVRVKADAMGKLAGLVAVVESVTAGRGGRWVCEVRGKSQMLESYYEEWLEAAEEGEE